MTESLPIIDDGEITSVQAAFLRVFVSLFRDYRKYLILKKNPRGGKKEIQVPSAAPSELPSQTDSTLRLGLDAPGGFEEDPTFRRDSFMKKSSREARPFLSKFVETQAFQRFIDQRVAPAPITGEAENYSIRFFDESIIAKNNRSRFRFSKPTPFLDSKMYDIGDNKLPAPEPDSSGLETGRVYQHTYFPRLQKGLFQATKTNVEIAEKFKGLPGGREAAKTSSQLRGLPAVSLTSIPQLVRKISLQSMRKKTSRVASKSFLVEISQGSEERDEAVADKKTMKRKFRPKRPPPRLMNPSPSPSPGIPAINGVSKIEKADERSYKLVVRSAREKNAANDAGSEVRAGDSHYPGRSGSKDGDSVPLAEIVKRGLEEKPHDQVV